MTRGQPLNKRRGRSYISLVAGLRQYVTHFITKEIAILLISIVGCSLAVPALAHFYETDNAISARLHITPDDDPVINEPSQLLFEFKDKEKKFAVPNCDCTATISRAGQEIFSEPLRSNNAKPNSIHASFSFTFPESDIYQVRVMGIPREPREWQPFTLTYDVRVARQASRFPGLGAHSLHLIGGGILGAFVAGLFIHDRFKRT